jgi:DNA polymerase III epsilon subunit-like protein
MRILVFDTETTGLPKTKILNKYVLELWPHIVQFSYIIYDTEIDTIIKLKDYIIKVPDSLVISEDVSKIHGITNEISFSKGVSITGVLDEFFHDFGDVDHIVGHNVLFDINMIKVELNRLQLDVLYANKNSIYQEYLNLLINSKNMYCTMKESIDLCAIETKDKFGRNYNKFPKLIELYQKLFQISPSNLHNSLNDVIVCLRCFMKLKYNKDIVEYSQEVKRLIKEYL